MTAMLAGAAALGFIVLHAPGGEEIIVNTGQMTSLRGPRETGARLFTDGAACHIGLTDGKFAAVTESCEQVRRLLKAE